MKTLSTLFLISWISIQLLSAQTPNTIPNASFENWTADTLFHVWEDFTTSNTLSQFFTGAPNVVSVPAPFGQAVHLTTHIAGTDTSVGELVLGSFCPAGFSGGMSFTAKADSLVAYLRYEVMSPDHASIVLVFKQNEMQKHIKYFPLNGSRPNYYRLALPLNLPAGPADYNQLAMVISSSNRSNALAGSWLEIDSLGFVGSTQQLVNPSFNEVKLLHFEDPNGWASPNISLGMFGGVTSISRDADAYDGLYAAKIQSVAFVSNCDPDTIGFMGEGKWDVIDGQNGGQPFVFTEKCMKVSGYYKYEAVGNDTAIAGILFSRYNALTAERDTVYGIIEALKPTASYQPFEIIIDSADFVIMPDSFHVVFQASDPDHFASQARRGDGSTLWVDALHLSPCIVGGLEDATDITFQLYPNPANQFVQLSWEAQAGHSYEIRLLDMQGKSLIQTHAQSGEIQLDIAKLPAGLYFVYLKDLHSEKRSSMKLVKE